MRVLIVDDELLARKRLHRLLEAMPDVEIVGELEDGAELPRRLAEDDVDLVLLDVQMEKMSGVEALGLIDGAPPVVFVTAHQRYAIDAFDGGAVDYLLKPVEPARLARALSRARERMKPKESRIGVTTRKGVVLLEPDQIRFALIDGETVTLHTSCGSFVTDFRIAELEKRLGDGFVRVHRRALVNLARVVRLEPNEVGGYVAHLEGGGEVPVSRQAARRLRRMWDLPRG